MTKGDHSKLLCTLFIPSYHVVLAGLAEKANEIGEMRLGSAVADWAGAGDHTLVSTPDTTSYTSYANYRFYNSPPRA